MRGREADRGMGGGRERWCYGLYLVRDNARVTHLVPIQLNVNYNHLWKIMFAITSCAWTPMRRLA